MQKRIYYLFCLASPFLALSTLSYFLISKTITLTWIQIINFSCFTLQTLLLVPFLLALILRFKTDYEETLRLLSSKIHSRIRTGVFVGSIVLCIFSYTNIFYEFFVRMRTEGGLWSIEVNIFVSLMMFVLCAKTLIIDRPNKMFIFSTYIILVILFIVFFAHLAIITEASIYLPELCLEILIIVILLDMWWATTPIFLHLTMIAGDIIAIEEFIRRMIVRKQPTGLIVYRVIVCFIILVHLVIKGAQMVSQVRKCFQQFYDDEMKDTPLSNIMISQIPLVQFKLLKQKSLKNQLDKCNQNQHQLPKQIQLPARVLAPEQPSDIQLSDVCEKLSPCAICTLQIEEDTLIYEIPCGHTFHSECLEKWLQLRNSCPTCRNPAI